MHKDVSLVENGLLQRQCQIRLHLVPLENRALLVNQYCNQVSQDQSVMVSPQTSDASIRQLARGVCSRLIHLCQTTTEIGEHLLTLNKLNV